MQHIFCYIHAGTNLAAKFDEAFKRLVDGSSSHLRANVEDDAEEINVEFLARLIAADDAKQRRDRRQQLLQEAEAEDSEEHLMREFAKAKPTERQLLWEKVKQEQAALLTQVKEEYRTSRSSKDSAKGDLMRHPRYTGEKVVLKEPIRPPTPPPKPQSGLQPKVAPKKRPDSNERSWIEKAGDSRKLLKVQVLGDRCEISPTLVPNPSSVAPFDDTTTGHHWEVLPACNSGTALQREMAICASGVGRYHALQDSKGACSFLEFMEKYEEELSNRLGDKYRYDPDWRQRWWDIIQGSNLVRYEFCWTHAQYEDVARLWPFQRQWWREVPTPLRVKITRGHAGPALDNDARGTAVPRGFAPSFYHFTYM